MAIEIVQNAYVTKDLQATCARLFAEFGIGPYILAADLELGEHRYRGERVEPVIIDAAFAQSGDLNIEIIQVKSTGPCAFSEETTTSNQIHHVAYFCDDWAMERDRITSLGYPVVSEFSIGDGVEICYIDTRPLFGHMIELYPRDPLLLGLYDRVRLLALQEEGGELLIPW
jgi:hypothetical protein